MTDFKEGDKIRIKDKSDWPLPTAYKLANVQGKVVEIIKEPEGYIKVLLDQNPTGIDPSVPLAFRVEAVEKI
jgi:hypothetical protein